MKRNHCQIITMIVMPPLSPRERERERERETPKLRDLLVPFHFAVGDKSLGFILDVVASLEIVSIRLLTASLAMN